MQGPSRNMAELTEENLELELRRGSEVDEGKPVLETGARHHGMGPFILTVH